MKKSIKQRVLWGLGGGADNLLYNGLNILLFPIFNIGLGVSAIWIGIASAIPRFLDAITDPLMGHISDNARTRFGRRRPFILAGSVLSGLLFFLLFLPTKDWSMQLTSAWLWVLLILFYLAYTVFMIPYTALGFEIEKDPKERLKVIAWRVYIGLVLGLAIPFLYKLSLVVSDDEVTGIKWVALLVAVIVASIGASIFIWVKEPPQTAEATIPLKKAILMTFRNRSFVVLAGCFLSLLFGIFIAMPLVLYIEIYQVFAGDKVAAAAFYGYYQVAIVLGGLAGTLLVPHISFSRWGVAKVLLLLGFMSAISAVWTFSGDNNWLQFAQAAAFGFSVNALFLLYNGFLGDLCDVEAKANAIDSRQGFYAASLEFSKKASISVASLASGVVIAWSGFIPDADSQGVNVLIKLHSAYPVIMGASFIVGYICFLAFERKSREGIDYLLMNSRS